MAFNHAVTSEGDLRGRYRPPGGRSLDKEIDHLDAAARSFIAASPFVVVASSGPGGADASPKGGPPGFVQVLDDHRLAIPDLAGNNRLDSFANFVTNPAVGLLFLVPGLDETLRVNGRATLTEDPVVLDACVVDGKRPRLAVGVDVDACYLHCAKAFRRAGVWDPSSWLPEDQRPDAACVLRDHAGMVDVEPSLIRAALEESYATTMWEVGGS